ncbi:MAG: hypothetical protein ACXWUG_03935 [Polyangiales bacterium]
MSDSQTTQDPLEDEKARDILVEAAHSIRWSIPDGATLAQLEAACMSKLSRIEGGQDHAHAKNGVRSAIEYARQGNAEYARAGLWEAKKVLELHDYQHLPHHER